MVLRMSSGHSNCQYKVAGYGHSKRCSADARRFAVRVWEESAGHHVGYAACYGCARWTVRLARQVAYMAPCSEIA
jgi:hypothetical protein